MKTILVQPQRNCTTESKAAQIINHLGWKLVHDGEADLKLWLSDAIQPDHSYKNSRDFPIEKAMVNRMFEMAFKYPVGVNPMLHNGPAIRKRPDHGTHGEVIQCPTARLNGFCYQKLLTNHPEEDWMDEFRVDVYGPKFLNTRKRLRKGRFGFPLSSRENDSFEFDCGMNMFSNAELINLWLFCMGIGLEFGSLDVIRHLDGKIYVIDATTNTGIPTISWHRNADLKKYLDVSAEYFQRGLL